VLDQGRIVACGNHEELMNSAGIYPKFVREQLSGGVTRIVA
jgi:ABC-type multidrug transport system fused ATPase/permease subunit